jgi:UDP-2,4-diacetamido-2,4,6-trideoxy-beta-L-altropyranose hydrolase
MTPTLVIRADASAQIGTGHVMRCLALGQGWRDRGGEVFIIQAPGAAELEQRLRSEQLHLVVLEARPGTAEDAAETAALARGVGARWVVVDGYHFDADYQRAIKVAGQRLLFIDDYGHAARYDADLVLNQNVYAHEVLYPHRANTTRLLLDTRYALLRREFLAWREWRRDIPRTARKVLVTLGGADPANVTLKVVDALKQIDVSGMEAIVVVGASNPHYQKLEAAAHDSRMAIRLVRNVTNMPELMAWADLAISAGGSSNWELALLGVPTIIVALAENQRMIAERLGALGAAVYLGWHADVPKDMIGTALSEFMHQPTARQHLSQQARAIVDGAGVARVLSHLEGDDISLRRAQTGDCAIVWEWANDPTVRAVSFSSEPIPWEAHVRWFEAKIADPACVFYIALDGNGTPIGQVRYDIREDEAIVSISIDQQFRRRGLGSTMIRLASQELFADSSASLIHAYIKEANAPSYRIFEKAGFQCIEKTTVSGHPALHFVLRRGEPR